MHSCYIIVSYKKCVCHDCTSRRLERWPVIKGDYVAIMELESVSSSFYECKGHFCCWIRDAELLFFVTNYLLLLLSLMQNISWFNIIICPLCCASTNVQSCHLLYKFVHSPSAPLHLMGYCDLWLVYAHYTKLKWLVFHDLQRRHHHRCHYCRKFIQKKYDRNGDDDWRCCVSQDQWTKG